MHNPDNVFLAMDRYEVRQHLARAERAQTGDKVLVALCAFALGMILATLAADVATGGAISRLLGA